MFVFSAEKSLKNPLPFQEGHTTSATHAIGLKMPDPAMAMFTAEQLKERQAHLQAQRDKLIQMKIEARQKAFAQMQDKGKNVRFSMCYCVDCCVSSQNSSTVAQNLFIDDCNNPRSFLLSKLQSLVFFCLTFDRE